MSSNEKQKKISVVIPAAGNGERFGGNVPKQFTTVIKKPILQYTVETFMAVPYVSEIIIIIKKQHVNDHLNKLLQNLREKKEIEIKIIEGDKYRHSSISNGISAIKCDPPPDVVIIHDAVRPVFTPELVTKVANLARIHGACGTVRPLVSTVVSINDDGFMDYSLDRCKFRASEMPQAFQYDIIKMAYQMCSNDDFKFGTECLHLVHKYCGVKPKLFETDEDLIKVTHVTDVVAVASQIREKELYVQIMDERPSKTELGKFIHSTLATSSIKADLTSVFENRSESMPSPGRVQNYNCLVLIHSDDFLSCLNSWLKCCSSDRGYIIIVICDVNWEHTFENLSSWNKTASKHAEERNKYVCIIWKRTEDTVGAEQFAISREVGVSQQIGAILTDFSSAFHRQIITC